MRKQPKREFASPSFVSYLRVNRALEHRRLKIAEACKQLKVDIESYNDNNPYGATVDVPSFDFTEDLAKAKAAERKT